MDVTSDLPGVSRMLEPYAVEKASHLLKTLAIGLLKQEENTQEQHPLPVTLLDPYLRQGWEELCYLCFRQGTLPPRTLPEFVRLLHQSCVEWPVVGENYATHGYSQALLSNGSATPLCVQLGEPFIHSYNPRLELDDENFRRLYEICLRRGDAEQYTKARTFINRHPVL